MRHRRILLSLAIVLTAAGTGFAQEGADEDVPVELQGGLDESAMLKDSLTSELQRLQKFTGVQDSVLEELRAKHEPLIAAHLKRKRLRRDHFVVANTTLPPKIIATLAKAAKGHVTDEAKYTPYKADVDARISFQQNAAINCFVELVDSFAGLTSKQRTAIKKHGDKLFEQGKLDLSMMMYQSLAQKRVNATELKDILTESQLAHVKYFKALASDDVPQADGDQEETITAQVRRAAEMRIEQIAAEVQLDKQQTQKLNVAAKRVISDATSKILKAKTAYKKIVEAFQSGNPPTEKIDPSTIAFANAGPVAAFDSERSKWTQFVDSQLTEAQKKRWQTFSQNASRFANERDSYELVTKLSPGMDLSGKQLEDLRKLIVNQLARSESEQSPGSQKSLQTIPDTAYVKAIGEENWKQLKTMLPRIQ